MWATLAVELWCPYIMGRRPWLKSAICVSTPRVTFGSWTREFLIKMFIIDSEAWCLQNILIQYAERLFAFLIWIEEMIGKLFSLSRRELILTITRGILHLSNLCGTPLPEWNSAVNKMHKSEFERYSVLILNPTN